MCWREAAIIRRADRAKLVRMRELIFGGARSGKSALAEKKALESGMRVVYVATAQALDAEMRRRIAHHQARRPASWGLVESPLKLAAGSHAAALILLVAGVVFTQPILVRAGAGFGLLTALSLILFGAICWHRFTQHMKNSPEA